MDRATDVRDRRIAAACALLLVIGMPFGYLSDDPDTGDVIGMLVLGGLSLAIMAALVLRFVPAQRTTGPVRATRTALMLGFLTVVTVAVFWTGLPFALGAAAISLGLWARGASTTGTGGATAAAVLGTLAVVVSFLLLLAG